MEIRLFKTNLHFKQKALALEPELNNLLREIPWNFDLEDRDKLLRIESDVIPLNDLDRLMKQYGVELTEIF